MQSHKVSGRPASLTPFFWIMILSGLSGWLLGAFIYPCWQHAAEGAQVIAGTVKYTAPSPFYWYQSNLWTLMHQVPALFLRLGISEMTISLFLSGLMGMISFQAISLISYSITEEIDTALLMPFFIQFTRAVYFGVVYPIQLFGGNTTYGILGFGCAVFTLALLGLTKNRSGYFMLGLLPAMHPGIGIFTLLVVLGTAFFGKQFLGGRFQITWRWLLAGIGISGLSFLWHLASARNLPHVSFSEAEPYLDNFIRFWCGHRRPVPPEDPGFQLHVSAAAIFTVLFLYHRNKFTDAGLYWITVGMVSGLLAIPLAMVSWYPAEKLPIPLLSFMPGRYVNFDIFIYPIFLLNIFFLRRSDFKSQVCWLILIAGLYFLARHWQVHPDWMTGGLSCGGAVWVILLFLRERPVRQAAFKIRFLGKILMAVALVKIIYISAFKMDAWRLEFYNSQDAAFWQSVSKDKGMLLTTDDLNQVQLRSRRPVLLEVAAVDGLPYAVESGPYMNQILKEFYCADLLHVPLSSEESFTNADQCVEIWKARTPEDWKFLAARYHFTQILTSPPWELQLPVKVRNEKYILYDLPA